MLITDKGLAFIYFHLVCASKFSMIQAMHKQKDDVIVYTSPNSALEHITYVMEQHRNVDLMMNKANVEFFQFKFIFALTTIHVLVTFLTVH